MEFSYDFHSFFQTYNFYFKIYINLKKRATLYAIPDRLMCGICMHVLMCDDVKLDRCQGTHEFCMFYFHYDDVFRCPLIPCSRNSDKLYCSPKWPDTTPGSALSNTYRFLLKINKSIFFYIGRSFLLLGSVYWYKTCLCVSVGRDALNWTRMNFGQSVCESRETYQRGYMEGT